jgi:lactate permease
MFHQVLNPTANLALTWLVALVPVLALLVLLAVFRVSAWFSTLIGSVITFLLAVWVWQMPLGDGL